MLETQTTPSPSGIWQSSYDFVCTWDLGRRCNLDCSYCPPHRHNNWSLHAKLEDLKNTARLPLQYGRRLREYSNGQIATQVSFTGGEPTLNPAFVPLCAYIKQQDPQLEIGLTTNGLMSSSLLEELIPVIDHFTISFHFEATAGAKTRITENIYAIDKFFRSGQIRNYSVNVMVHAKNELFEECLKLIADFLENGIRYSLRVIGEHPGDPESHMYTEAQIEFIKNNGIIKLAQAGFKLSTEKIQGHHAGRVCCGGRSFKEVYTVDDESVDAATISAQPEVKRLSYRRFKGWSCFVNLFFLHIHDEEKKIYYHQTCQARPQGGRGPIGSTDRVDEILSELEARFQSKKLQPVVCPNAICNCGLCITKSKNPQMLKSFIHQTFADFELST